MNDFDHTLAEAVKHNNIDIINLLFSTYKDKISSVNLALSEAVNQEDHLLIAHIVANASDKINAQNINMLFSVVIVKNNESLFSWLLENRGDLLTQYDDFIIRSLVWGGNIGFYERIRDTFYEKINDITNILTSFNSAQFSKFKKFLEDFESKEVNWDIVLLKAIKDVNTELTSFILDNYSDKIKDPYKIVSAALNANNGQIRSKVMMLEPKISHIIKDDPDLQKTIHIFFKDFKFTYELERSTDTAPATAAPAATAAGVGAPAAGVGALAATAGAPAASAAGAPAASAGAHGAGDVDIKELAKISVVLKEVKVLGSDKSVLPPSETPSIKKGKKSKNDRRKGGESCCSIL
jgi:hypothetical protein